MTPFEYAALKVLYPKTLSAYKGYLDAQKYARIQSVIESHRDKLRSTADREGFPTIRFTGLTMQVMQDDDL